jgi:hypothetical protein
LFIFLVKSSNKTDGKFRIRFNARVPLNRLLNLLLESQIDDFGSTGLAIPAGLWLFIGCSIGIDLGFTCGAAFGLNTGFGFQFSNCSFGTAFRSITSGNDFNSILFAVLKAFPLDIDKLNE